MIKEIKNENKVKMEKAIQNLKEELSSIRAGRANPKILDRVMVEYYGTPTPLNQLANISCPEARMILVQPWDPKSIPDLEKAIIKSDLGFNPGNDGKVIRLVIPQLTEDRRKELVKLAKKQGEESKVAIRNIRRNTNTALKNAEKEGLITEDELKSVEVEIQKITDEEIKKIDEIISAKNIEILEV
ncbi:ribosome recycling factor [Alkalibaculum sp. M08DMB]|uniref:Ribosome-recycling factor n=1 Tax=Alkalibaculum sporogenes TaxID=2655001 RepID=A0A6A7K8U5_9FIRM|nr:ribosome recycling factor [Alkalibaculum sporogenes]MPW25844.1 ribosome recycling factor [Alkalibaculum sporogenes]